MTEEAEIKYVECYVAFIDILGFKHLVNKSQDDPAILGVLVKVLNNIANTPRAYHSTFNRDSNGTKNGDHEYLVQVRAFSDCIFLFVPVASRGLSSILDSVRYIHDRMIEFGFVIRGAVTIGKMYYEDSWSKSIPEQFKECKNTIEKIFNCVSKEQKQVNDGSEVLYDINRLGRPVTLGPAMIEACLLERDCAIYPRVIISQKLFKHINDDQQTNKKTFSLVSPSIEMAPKKITDFICHDFDGAYYFDFLDKDIKRQDTERIVKKQVDGRIVISWERSTIKYCDFLKIVKETIEKELREPLPEKVMLKYQWLKNYFNHKCGENLKIS